MTELTLPEAIEYALQKLGAEGGVVVGGNSASNNLRWANSALTTNGDSAERTIAISAFVGVSGGVGSGMASGQFRDRRDIDDLVSASVAAAKSAGPAVDAMDLVSGPQHEDFETGAQDLGVTELTHVSRGLANILPNKSQEFFGYAEQSRDTTYVGTSSGTRMKFVENTSRFELSAKSLDRTRSAWSGQGGTSLEDVVLANHADEVCKKLEFQRNLLDIDPGRHKVTLSPSAVADLMIYFLWSAAARDAAEGRNAFANPKGGTRVGEQISSRNISMVTDPHAPGIEAIDHVVALGSSAFSTAFDTGLPISKSHIITNGTLTALGSSRHAAQTANLPFTPLSENLMFSDATGAGSLDQLAARMGDGLLITCLWYIREVDPQNLLLTGLTRDGVYVVRDGQVIGAANNFRFNESPIDMLKRVIDAGEMTPCLPREWADYFSRAQVAPLTIEGFNLSTRSDAV